MMSLNYSGNCTYDGTISPLDITRYTILTIKKIKSQYQGKVYIDSTKSGTVNYNFWKNTLEKIHKEDIWKPPLAKEVVIL